jgi:predicted enzyme related to lactoylglutathione lyase
MAGEPSWFEIGVEDVEKGRAFYSAVLGWELTPLGSGGFVIGTPGVSGGIHGGDPAATSMAFFAVDDLDATLALVAHLGGERVTIHEDTDEGPTHLGRFAICRDDQGSLFGLHEAAG